VLVQYEEVADKEDLIGVEDNARKGVHLCTVYNYNNYCS